MTSKQIISRVACVLALISVAVAASTNTATVTWNPPTTYSDGSPLPSSDIDHYTITWAPSSPQAGPSGSMNSPAPSGAAVIPIACGSTSFTISVTTGPNARYPNSTSSPAGPVPYASGIGCAPNPPSGLAVH